MDQVKILLVDDHALLRDGLRQIIDAENAFAVVAEAGSIREALDIARREPLDLLVVDIALPDGLGTDLVRRLSAEGRPLPTIVISMHESPSFVDTAREAGCAAYVAKRSASSQLVTILRAVAAGERPLQQQVPSVAAEVPDTGASVPAVTGAIPTLSRREEQVLALVAGGATNQEAADCLGVSVKTVEGYRLRVTRKLGVRSRAELVRVALAAGLIHD